MKKEMTQKLNRAKVILTTAALSIATLPMTVSAAGLQGSEASATATGIVGDVIESLVQIGGGLAGAIFMLMGLIKLLTAYHNNQPQEMHASVKDIIVGAAFLGLAVLIAPAMSALGLA